MRRLFAPATTVALIGIFAFGPVYWVLVTALTPTHEVFRFPPHFIPDRITFEHFTAIFDNPGFCGISPTV